MRLVDLCHSNYIIVQMDFYSPIFVSPLYHLHLWLLLLPVAIAVQLLIRLPNNSLLPASNQITVKFETPRFLPTSNWNFCLIFMLWYGRARNTAKLSCDNAVSWSQLHHVISLSFWNVYTVNELCFLFASFILDEKKTCNFHFVCTISYIKSFYKEANGRVKTVQMQPTRIKSTFSFSVFAVRFVVCLFLIQFSGK